MYTNSVNNSEAFANAMYALKKENQEIKAIRQSEEYKFGEHFHFLLSCLRDIEIDRIIKKAEGKFRWKLLCKKYPIHHNSSETFTPNYFSDERFVVYTCIFGDYDTPKEPLFVPDNCDFYIITDQEINSNSKWKKKNVDILFGQQTMSNAEKNRFCKMFPHIIFPEVRYSIYIDGNIKPISDLTEMINLCTSTGMALHMHKARTCVYEEIEACKILKKASSNALNQYKSFLIKSGFPHGYGMNECNVIVRDHTNNLMKTIMREWWDMYKNGIVKRDQLSFPFILYKHGVTPKEIGVLGSNVQDNPCIYVTQHK